MNRAMFHHFNAIRLKNSLKGGMKMGKIMDGKDEMLNGDERGLVLGRLTLALSGRGQSGGTCRRPREGRTRYASAEGPG